MLSITRQGQSIVVSGVGNDFYPDNGTLTYPVNSVVCVTDESDIVTFRSAANNDVYFSGIIGEITIGGTTVTKQDIHSVFGSVSNASSGGGGGGTTDGYSKEETDALLAMKQDKLTSGTTIKTVNGESLLGSGDVTIKTSIDFPVSWRTTGTFANLLADIVADASATAGKQYMKTVTLTDLPAGLSAAEMVIQVLKDSPTKVVLFTITSYDTAPYHWERTGVGSDTNEWRGFVTDSALASYYTGTQVDNKIQGVLDLVSEKQDASQVDAKVAAGVTLADSHTDAKLAGYVNAAGYDSEAKQIQLKNGSTVVATIDATPFVKDGMVDSVVISGGNIVITFNTDAGKQAISIPLTGIFNPANYYDKTAVDTALAGKANTADVYTKTEVDDAIENAVSNIPAIDAYTKTEVNGLLAGKADAATTYTKTEVDAKADALTGSISTEVARATAAEEALEDGVKALETSVGSLQTAVALKANTADVYTKSDTDAMLLLKADKSDVYTKTATDTLLGAKADASTTYTKTEVDAALTGKLGNSDVLVEVDSLSTDTVSIVAGVKGKGVMLVESSTVSFEYYDDEAKEWKDLTHGTVMPDENVHVVRLKGSSASPITVDSAMSATSTNPVQNRAIYAAIGDIASVLDAINGETV